jgi:hypothetical protein
MIHYLIKRTGFQHGCFLKTCSVTVEFFEKYAEISVSIKKGKITAFVFKFMTRNRIEVSRFSKIEHKPLKNGIE